MKLKKTVLALFVVIGLVSVSITSFATSHTHAWDNDQFYAYQFIMPSPNDDWEKCATRITYNYHQCTLCGDIEIFIVDTTEMKHTFVNDECTICHKGTVKKSDILKKSSTAY